MSDYVIQKGIPIPPVDRGHRKCNWPFLAMEVGDSFDAPRESRKAVASATSNWKKNHPGWDFTRRLLEDGSTRVWCTARPDGKADVVPAPKVNAPAPVLDNKAQKIPKLDGRTEISNVTAKLREAARQGGSGIRTVRMR